jgi:ParB-like chromosome segregation protein Spo0J
MKIHALAKLFPEITGQDFKDLVASIKAHGLMEEIVTLDGQVLDGQNRLKACKAAGVEPKFREFTGKDPLAFVVAENIARRHLTAGQRSLLAVKISECGNSHMTQEKAAQKLHVSRESVSLAKQIKGKSPKLAKRIEAGKISLNEAHRKINPKPLPRGGLAAEAIRAKQAEAQKPAALKGIDMGKVDRLNSQEPPEGFGADEISKALNPNSPITPKEFQSALDALEAKIPAEADHKPYFNAASKLAERLAQHK